MRPSAATRSVPGQSRQGHRGRSDHSGCSGSRGSRGDCGVVPLVTEVSERCGEKRPAPTSSPTSSPRAPAKAPAKALAKALAKPSAKLLSEVDGCSALVTNGAPAMVADKEEERRARRKVKKEKRRLKAQALEARLRQELRQEMQQELRQKLGYNGAARGRGRPPRVALSQSSEVTKGDGGIQAEALAPPDPNPAPLAAGPAHGTGSQKRWPRWNRQVSTRWPAEERQASVEPLSDVAPK